MPSVARPFQRILGTLASLVSHDSGPLQISAIKSTAKKLLIQAQITTFLAAVQAQLFAISFAAPHRTIQIISNAFAIAGIIFNVIAGFLSLMSAGHLTTYSEQLSLLHQTLERTTARKVYDEIYKQNKHLPIRSPVGLWMEREIAIFAHKVPKTDLTEQTDDILWKNVISCSPKTSLKFADKLGAKISRMVALGSAGEIAMGYGVLCFFVNSISLAAESQDRATWITGAAILVSMPMLSAAYIAIHRRGAFQHAQDDMDLSEPTEVMIAVPPASEVEVLPHMKHHLAMRPTEPIKEWKASKKGKQASNKDDTISPWSYLSEGETLQDIMEKPKESTEPDVLTAMHTMALGYAQQGQWAEAERLQTQVTEWGKALFGETHSRTLTSMHNLATIYAQQGHLAAAAELQQRVLEKRKTLLSEDHPYTLDTMSNLALTYRQQNRLTEAEQLQLEIVEKRTSLLGRGNTTTLASMASLASIYIQEGKYSEAEAILTEMVSERWDMVEIDGKRHEILNSLTQLGSIYDQQARWAEAQVLLEKVVEKQTATLGGDDPATLRSLTNLAWIYFRMDQVGAAEKVQAEVLAKQTSLLGDEDKDTLTTMWSLGLTLSKQGRWAEAESLLSEVVEKRKTRLGTTHATTLVSMSSLASTYLGQGKYSEAEAILRNVVEEQKKMGEDSVDLLVTMHELAIVLQMKSRLSEARKLMGVVVQKRKLILGDRHPETEKSIKALEQMKR